MGKEQVWVPAWAVEAQERMAELAKNHPDDEGHQFFSAKASLLIQSPRMEKAWRAIDRRLPSSTDHFCFVGAVGRSLWAFRGIERLTRRNRRKSLQDIASAARLLAASWRDLPEFRWQCFQKICPQGDFHPGSVFDSAAFIFFTGNPGRSWLLAVADTADEWSKGTGSTVSRPNGKNAARLFFLRSLTAELREGLGKPLRSTVYDTASVFFEMDDITPNDIAKLAP